MPSYIPELFNTDPYYDDFNEDKKFLRIMFRPGYGVQARELTQLQTIVQNQIERFGSHVFEEGSMVLDGKITINSLQYARVTGLSGTSDITDFVGSVIYGAGATGGGRATAKIVHAETGYSGSSIDNFPVIFYEYLEGGTGFRFSDTVGATASGTWITANITGNASTGIVPVGSALVVSVDRGVRFTEGFFVLNDAQSLGSYSLSGSTGSQVRMYDNPTTRMGFNVVKEFVQSEDDSTLNDPAYGSYNYNAPGADRFKIDLQITQHSFTPSDTSTTDNFSRKDFIEFLRLVDGSPIKIEKYPDYAALEDTLARRTYDESGNYTVRPFEVNLKNGSGTTGGLVAELEPGKAYIFGYEFETQGITRLPIDSARDNSHVRTLTDKYFNRSLGPYAYVTFGSKLGLTGFKNFDEQQKVYLGNGLSGSTWTQLGTARLRWIEPYAGSVYSLHMFNVEMAGTASFNDVTRIFMSATGSTHAFAITGNSGLVNLQNGNLLYEFPTGTRGKTVTDADYAIAGFFDVVPNSGAFSNPTTAGVSRGTIDVTQYAVSSTDVLFSIPAVNTSLPNADIMAFNNNGVALGGTACRISAGNQIDLTLSGVTAGEPVFVVASIDVKNINNPNLRRDKSLITEEITFGAAGFTGMFQGITGDRYGNSVLYLAGKVDVVEVLSLTGTKGTSTAQLKSYFTFDNGQRDNVYDWSRLVMTQGVTGITGPYQATVKRYSRSGDRGPFVVDSYPAPYSDIPQYTSKTTGKTYDLADVIDFRPDMGPSGNIVGYPWFPINTAANDQLFTYQHYLPRTDKIALTRDRAFTVIKGIPSLDAQTPPDDPNAMTLYSVTVNPYTFDKDDVSIRFVENKRYTMRDIGELEKRIEAVEYYTTLSLLEQEAKHLSIVDDSNIEIPKKGILVDQFKGHNIGDVTNPMYAASIDFERNELRPPFASNVVGLTGPINSYTIGLTSSGDGIVTLPYTTLAEITQPLATTTLIVNPSSVFNYLGTLKLSPAGDYWFDASMTPSVKVNVDGENDAWQFGTGTGSQWNDWESIWYGREVASEANTKQNGLLKNSVVAGTNKFSLGNTFKSGLPEGIKRKSMSKIVRKDVVPFMRDRDIYMSATGLKPNTKFYVFVDDLDVTPYCTGPSQVTSAKGEVTNLRYRMDQDTAHSFLTGRRVFRITDSSTNSVSDATMAADAVFNSAGTVDPLGEDNILSTRPADIRRRSVKSSKVQSNLNELLSTDFFGFTEPLSQTFYVDPTAYPDGVYVKKVGVAFAAVDSNGNTPITLMLKPTQSGYPHPAKVMPFGQKTVYAGDITTSLDGSTETLFTFSSPIYLLPGNEYAISLSTNSSSFSVYGATIGDDIIRLSEADVVKKATKQPSIRSVFLPQNTGTLSKKDTESLKFSIHLCKFSPQSGSMTYENLLGSSLTAGFDAMRLNVNYATPSNTTATFDENGLLSNSGFLATQSNKTINRPVDRTTRNFNLGTKFTEMRMNFVGNDYVSPMVDLETSHYLIVGNKINNNTVLGTNLELYPTNFGATSPSEARYITKQVTLEPGFEATDVHVQMSLCNPYDSSIQVFVRPLPVGESDFSSIGYTKLTANDSGYSQNPDDFREVSFESTGLGLTKFRAFAIKIVMFASCTSTVPSDPRSLPRIKNLRIVAT
jgi:Domain of unknown function (DUF4815)